MTTKLYILLLFAYFGILGLVNAQSLPDYLEMAAENNSGLRASYKAFEAAAEDASRVAGLPNPTLSFGYFINPVETRIGPQQAKFSISQMLPWFGTLSAKKNAASARAEAKYYEFVAEREKLMSAVKRDYYELWERRQLIGLEQDNLEILKTYKALANSKLRVGTGSLADVHRVEIGLEENHARIGRLEKVLPPLKRALNRRLNRNAGVSIQLPDTIEPPFIPKDSIKVSGHPRLRGVESMQKSVEYQKTASNRNGLPRLGVSLNYVMVGERNTEEIPDNGNDALMPMLTLSLPIWHGQYGAAKRKATLKEEQYALKNQAIRDELQSGLDLARYKLQTAMDDMQLYKGEIDLAEKTLELIISDYANGRADFEEILELQQQIIGYKRQRLSAYLNLLNSYATVQYLSTSSSPSKSQ